MELQQIVERYAEAIEHVDGAGTHVPRVNRRTGVRYLRGFKALEEETAVDAVDAAWDALHPGELLRHRVKIRYPGLPGTAKCDHVFSTGVLAQVEDEWGIEVKRLQLVGDNGKKNDFSTTKMLSPYLKDRGMLHDALRLREHGFTRRIAVVGYSFDYDRASLLEARRHHTSSVNRAVIAEISKVVNDNGGHLRTQALIEFADGILRSRGLTVGPRAETRFEAWQHPAGGRGVVFGWEIRRPHLEADYDARHPW